MHQESFVKPIWLAAYPNEGSLDYFGFRFYRQPNRKYMVRGAAANNFRNAKTLLYFSSVAYAFRLSVNNLDENLDQYQLKEWAKWYKNAYYLYIILRQAIHGDVPDSGFTGAKEEYEKNFKDFFQSKEGVFDLNTTYERIFPSQRQWGYFKQFWVAPFKYFLCIFDIENCGIGEYAEDCYELLEQDTLVWNKFIKVVKHGTFNYSELIEILPILESKYLTDSEQTLAKSILFDYKQVYSEENLNYKNAFRLINQIRTEGWDGFIPTRQQDYALIFSYAFLKNEKISSNDVPWKILYSSIIFEVGICRFFSFLNEISVNGVMKKKQLDTSIRRIINNWLEEKNHPNLLGDLMKSWKSENLLSIEHFRIFFDSIFKPKGESDFIEPLLVGIMLKMAGQDYRIDYPSLVSTYHSFIPQVFFQSKNIDGDIDVNELFSEMAQSLIDEQYEFSLERMLYGQKAKFILQKSDHLDQYVFQIDKPEFKESTGIIDMIGACLDLWDSANIRACP